MFQSSKTAEFFWSLLLPVSTITLVVIILHVLSFYPAQVAQLVEYEGSSPFEVVGSSPTLRPISPDSKALYRIG